jgi:hypothetical protein
MNSYSAKSATLKLYTNLAKALETTRLTHR